MATILSSPFFINLILPFILVFTAVYAILQKSEIFGKGKKQIDSLIALAIALITISFANAVGIITSLMPFLAVSAVIILVLMLLIGLFNKEGEFDKAFSENFRKSLLVLVVIAVIAAVLVVTGAWNYILANWVYGSGSELVTNVVFIILIGIAAWIMLRKDKKSDE